MFKYRETILWTLFLILLSGICFHVNAIALGGSCAMGALFLFAITLQYYLDKGLK